jgi:hypothetical protein
VHPVPAALVGRVAPAGLVVGARGRARVHGMTVAVPAVVRARPGAARRRLGGGRAGTRARRARVRSDRARAARGVAAEQVAPRPGGRRGREQARDLWPDGRPPGVGRRGDQPARALLAAAPVRPAPRLPWARGWGLLDLDPRGRLVARLEWFERAERDVIGAREHLERREHREH